MRGRAHVSPYQLLRTHHEQTDMREKLINTKRGYVRPGGLARDNGRVAHTDELGEYGVCACFKRCVIGDAGGGELEGRRRENEMPGWW